MLNIGRCDPTSHLTTHVIFAFASASGSEAQIVLVRCDCVDWVQGVT